MTTFDAAKYKESEKLAYTRGAESYAKIGGPIFEALALPLLDGASLHQGQKVLDVGCGPGIPSLRVAELVAPGGSVVGIDLAPGMVDLAASRAQARGIGNVEFCQRDAEDLPFPDESFDRVLSHLALMHFPDRVRALNEMRRVLKPSGRLALSVWSTPDRCMVIGIAARVVAELWPAAVMPGAPTWFDFGPEGKIEALLSEMGFTGVKASRFDKPLEVRDGAEYWETVLGVSGRLRMLLENVPPEVAKKIEDGARRDVERLRGATGLNIPCEEVVCWASKEP